MSEPAVTSDRIKRLAAEFDFALCGITEAKRSDHADHVRDWLAAGKHGSMTWLADHVEQRLDPRVMLEGAKSIICVADHFGPNAELGARSAELKSDESLPTPHSELQTPNSGRIARYAQFDDYHKIIKKRLHALADQLRELAPDEQFRVCVDTAPVLEREHAARAGLGWIGKNTLLIQPHHFRGRGSHLMLGEIITTLALKPDRPEPDHCGTCTRCIDACPTGCITPYSVDASRCLSYLTIEHRGGIAPEFDAPLGDWLFGCDICQDVCPYNGPPAPGSEPPKLYGSRPAALDLLTVLNWTPEARTAALIRSSMKRAKLDQFKRNALLVASNQRPIDPALTDRIARIAEDPGESDMVRGTAVRVIDRLRRRSTD